MAQTIDKQKVFDHFNNSGQLDYGSVIPSTTLAQVAGISFPTINGASAAAIIRGVNAYELKMLEYSGFIVDKLLDMGKYLKKDGDTYRVLMPSENEGQVNAYISAGTKKLSRAERLHRSTPVNVSQMVSNTSNRIFSKQQRAKKLTTQIGTVVP